MAPRYVWMNGRLLAFENAKLHFLTAGLHYGIGVFEGIRCYLTPTGPGIFRLRDHLQRFLASARVLGLSVPLTIEELAAAVKETVAANGFAECYIRPVIYLADGGMDLSLDSGVAHLGIAAWEWRDFIRGEARERGIRAHVSSFTRHHPNVTMTKAKITGNYVNSVLAKTEALRLGFDEAILLDPSGYVAECSAENLFLVRRGVMYTPPTATVLEGITRDSIITLARDLGFRVVEEPISRDQLYIADEVFLCGTAAEVVTVGEIDLKPIGDIQPGLVSQRLQRAYHNLVRGQHARSAAWIEHVSVPEVRDTGQDGDGRQRGDPD